MSMECRRIQTKEELQQALAVRKEVFVEEQQVPIEEEIDGFDRLSDACRHYLVTEALTPIGAARWREYAPGTAKLQRIAVRKPWRSRGIGRLLVEAMERDAAASGCRLAVLDAQCVAEPFYRKLGYETQSAEPFLDAGIPHVRMSKPLPAVQTETDI